MVTGAGQGIVWASPSNCWQLKTWPNHVRNHRSDIPIKQTQCRVVARNYQRQTRIGLHTYLHQSPGSRLTNDTLVYIHYSAMPITTPAIRTTRIVIRKSAHLSPAESLLVNNCLKVTLSEPDGLQIYRGGAGILPSTCSHHLAALSNLVSSILAAISCIPRGKSDCESPEGTVTVGSPVDVHGP